MFRWPQRFVLAPLFLIGLISLLGLGTVAQAMFTRAAPASPSSIQGLPVGFAPGNLVVVRVGDGSAALSGAAAPVFLDEVRPEGSVVQSVAMPTSVMTDNARLTLSGSATSEGFLSRSADGRYLVLAGYDADVGTASVVNTSAAVVNRVVARVDAVLNVDTSTRIIDGFNNANVRSVASDDGSRFWVAGNGALGTGGIRYVPLGNVLSTTQVLTTPNNARVAEIFHDQLYLSTGSSPYNGVNLVGMGLPTTPTTATLITATTSTSPYDYVFLDRSAAVDGDDTLYVASQNNGLLKYSYDGSQWTSQGSLSGVMSGIVGVISGTEALLYATSGSSTSTITAVVRLVDSAFYDQPLDITSNTTVITAANNARFRGLAWAPSQPPTITAVNPDNTLAGLSSTPNVVISGINFSFNAQVYFGTQLATCVVEDSTRIVCDAPANFSVGSVDVTVLNPGASGDTLVDGFTYTGVANESDTPGEADYCVLQFPPTLSVTSTMTTPPIYGRIYEAGVTEPAGAPAGVTAEVGYGPDGSDPTLSNAWHFFATTYNVQAGNDDEFQGMFMAPTVATTTTFAYAYRFSLDGGQNFTYCDLNGAGSNAGLTFEPSQLGELTVLPQAGSTTPTPTMTPTPGTITPTATTTPTMTTTPGTITPTATTTPTMTTTPGTITPTATTTPTMTTTPGTITPTTTPTPTMTTTPGTITPTTTTTPTMTTTPGTITPTTTTTPGTPTPTATPQTNLPFKVYLPLVLK